MIGKLAAARAVPLPARLQRTRPATQLHQIVHELRRNPKMPGRLPVAVALIDKRCNTLTQRHRMRLAHRGSPSTAMNHQNFNLGIPNPLTRDAL